ncbi:MAG: QueT transporter family protein [Nitrososphaerota archaeon]|nr:QueT transporter family protein [Aigarchaeota archaeon]MDW8076814.1 QueT transporter family protein [Nitrososphaerota archaeon]
MSSRTKSIAISSVLATLYAVLVITLAPFSFLPFQLRVADALLPLSIVFGIPAAYGLSIGCAVANYAGGLILFGGASIIDVTGGALANFLACYLAWLIGRYGSIKRRFVATFVQTAVITSIVGSYLWVLVGMPGYYDIFGFELPGLLAVILGVAIGSFIAINVMGFALEETVRRMLYITDK